MASWCSETRCWDDVLEMMWWDDVVKCGEVMWWDDAMRWYGEMIRWDEMGRWCGEMFWWDDFTVGVDVILLLNQVQVQTLPRNLSYLNELVTFITNVPVCGIDSKPSVTTIQCCNHCVLPTPENPLDSPYLCNTAVVFCIQLDCINALYSYNIYN